MSRSGYSDEVEDTWALIRWRGAVESALRGKRGQALLRDLIVALDAMSKKRLIQGELQEGEEVCALGAVGRMRGIDMGKTDPDDYEQVAPLFGIAEALAREVMYENDEGGYSETPERRWERMRKWALENLATGARP